MVREFLFSSASRKDVLTLFLFFRFLNAFWLEGLDSEAENVWKFTQKFIELDSKKKEGNELDEFLSHKVGSFFYHGCMFVLLWSRPLLFFSFFFLFRVEPPSFLFPFRSSFFLL